MIEGVGKVEKVRLDEILKMDNHPIFVILWTSILGCCEGKYFTDWFGQSNKEQDEDVLEKRQSYY